MVKTIPDSDYFDRVKRLQARMAEQNLDAVLCYADTGVYENVFYLSKYWPLFEVGGVLVGRTGTPLVLIGGEAPEFGAQTPYGMAAVRGCTAFGHTSGTVRDWVGVTYYDLKQLFSEVTDGKGVTRLGLADYNIAPHPLYEKICDAIQPGGEVVL